MITSEHFAKFTCPPLHAVLFIYNISKQMYNIIKSLSLKVTLSKLKAMRKHPELPLTTTTVTTKINKNVINWHTNTSTQYLILILNRTGNHCYVFSIPFFCVLLLILYHHCNQFGIYRPPFTPNLHTGSDETRSY